jgi:hypothetical protein
MILAEKIITAKINDCKSIGDKEDLGNLYEQLAMVSAHKKNTEIRNLFSESFSIPQEY